MNCEQSKQYISMLVDGELAEAQQTALEDHLQSCQSCAAEYQSWQSIGRELSTMKYSLRHDRELDAFEGHVYARMERGIAWLLLSLGAILLLGGGSFYLVRDFLLNSDVSLALRAGVAAMVLGGVVLMVHVVRHRLATRRSDPYKGVKR